VPLVDGRVIAILRHLRFEQSVRCIDALISAGIRCVEVTMDSPNSGKVISETRTHYPQVAVGAGSVLDATLLGRALDAGASFVLSPHVDPQLIARAGLQGVPFVAGALSPTEAVVGMAAGAAAIKLFPAMPGGPGYLRSLRQPLPGIPFVPTGGVTPANVQAFFEAGAAAVALGAALTNLEGPALTEAGRVVVAAAEAAPTWSW
jgi:2-dehydro-3-deoxyphosphogluconate aldolase / (4S)-4-hydroxy-2-oxoglutarate aldolase